MDPEFCGEVTHRSLLLLLLKKLPHVIVRTHMSSVGSPLPPQFGKAEYLGQPGVDRCTMCHQPAGNWYFRVNGAMACTPCAQSARNAAPPDSAFAYTRALLFGAGAAFAGLVFLAVFGIITGVIVGYLSLGVGYLVGKAMMKGSRGIGGPRYQVTAALLTYLAVSMSAIPMGIAYGVQHKGTYQRPTIPTQKKPADLAEDQRRLEQEFGSGGTQAPARRAMLPASPAPDRSTVAAPAPQDRQTSPHVPQQKPRSTPAMLGYFLGYLWVMALASPLLWLQSPFQGVIALLVLIVGIVVACRITAAKRSEIIGPFRNAPTTR